MHFEWGKRSFTFLNWSLVGVLLYITTLGKCWCCLYKEYATNDVSVFVRSLNENIAHNIVFVCSCLMYYALHTVIACNEVIWHMMHMRCDFYLCYQRLLNCGFVCIWSYCLYNSSIPFIYLIIAKYSSIVEAKSNVFRHS